jgi:hypothetical protein
VVAPGKEAEVAVALASRLGVALVGARSPAHPPPGWAGGAVTSVYVDAPPSFPVHAARAARADGAALTRVRWYGAGEDGTRWVETKTHRAPGSGAVSAKERAGVGADAAAALLDPASPAPPGLPPLAAALGAAVRGGQTLRPVLATRAARVAFEGGRAVRVTLDTGLTFLGGDGAAPGLRAWVTAGGPHPPSPLPATASFPFAVLEVKTPYRADGTPSAPPPWLAALVCDPGLAAPAPRLSKYLAGAVALFPDAGLDTVGCLGLEGVLAGSAGGQAAAAAPGDGDSATSVEAAAPPPPKPVPPPPPAAPAKPRPPRRAWLLSKPKRGFFLRRSASGAPLLPVLARTEAGSVGGGGEVGASAAGASPAPASWPPRGRVADAKVFFSNERTMLSWLQISVLLLLLGVSLLNGGGGGGRDVGGLPGQTDAVAPTTHSLPSSSSPATKAALVAGGIVAPCSVIFMAYAFLVFRRRSGRLARGLAGAAPSQAFDDARGAAVLVALVLLAGVASLAAAFARVGEGV